MKIWRLEMEIWEGYQVVSLTWRTSGLAVNSEAWVHPGHRRRGESFGEAQNWVIPKTRPVTVAPGEFVVGGASCGGNVDSVTWSSKHRIWKGSRIGRGRDFWHLFIGRVAA